MLCAGNVVPVSKGKGAIDFCFEHFEPADRAHPGQKPAYVLHSLGVATEDQLVAFVLVPTAPGEPSQWFLGRWGRTGVGPVNFMPVPQQVEDDRLTLNVYGFKFSNFNWRSCQWEVAEILNRDGADIPSLNGDLLESPANVDGIWAFRDGVPLANVDSLDFGEHPELGLKKEPEAGQSFQIKFGGRIWRRWLDGRLDLLAFDTESPVLQSTLEDVWADIGGQDDAKRELIRAIQWPVLYPELFLLFKRKRSKGVLLYGPPGCGKTLLGKAVVRLLAALYHRKADDGGFKYVKGHQLLDMYLGQSEKAVKSLFDEAKRFREQKGYPAVLFFDEADALFKRRPSGASESGFTLVPSLLAEMDGMEESGAFVMLATNRPDALDLAITRPGRIDRRIRITRPDRAASATIFRIHLEGVFLDTELSVEQLSRFASEELFNEEHKLYQLQFEDAEAPFYLKDLASGALIQNIVDRATANKMEYCIQHGVTAGLNREDLRIAVEEVLAEQRETRHTEELQEFAELRGRELVGMRRN